MLPYRNPDSGIIRATIFDMNNEVEAIVTGKLLLEYGIEPGPRMGEIISKALEIQLKGKLTKDNWKQVLKQHNIKI